MKTGFANAEEVLEASKQRNAIRVAWNVSGLVHFLTTATPHDLHKFLDIYIKIVFKFALRFLNFPSLKERILELSSRYYELVPRGAGTTEVARPIENEANLAKEFEQLLNLTEVEKNYHVIILTISRDMLTADL